MIITQQEIINRWQKYQAIILKRKLDMLIISSPGQLFYTTNYLTLFPPAREGIAIVTPKKVTFFIPSMYANQTAAVFQGVHKEVVGERFWEVVAQYLKDKKTGFEGADLTYTEYTYLKKQAKRMVSLDRELSVIRTIKSKEEIALVTEAEQITEKALEAALSTIKTGMTEKEIARVLEYQMEILGADGLAFPTIVASGPNSANPHHYSGLRQLQEGDVLLIDMGAKKNGYCGDLTRTYSIGKMSDEYKRTYELVLRVQEEAIALLKPGIPAKKVDLAVRNLYENSKCLDHYLHTTGHGVGIDIHEAPSVSFLSDFILKPGMIITIEPGLYYPEWGGVRIEDVAVITEKGSQLLSSINKQLILLNL